MKYRKKPVVIEAMELTQATVDEVFSWAWSHGDRLVQAVTEGLNIETLEGVMLASWGDFVIKGVAGEFYPCKPDIFAATYEEVDG